MFGATTPLPQISISDTTISVASASILNAAIAAENGSLTLTNVNAEATGASAIALWLTKLAGPALIDRGTLNGGSGAINNSTSSGVTVRTAQVSGGVANTGGGALSCAFAYGSDFTALNAACN